MVRARPGYEGHRPHLTAEEPLVDALWIVLVVLVLIVALVVALAQVQRHRRRGGAVVTRGRR